MSIKIGINGLGRIGRGVFRAMFSEYYQNDFDLVHINNLSSPSTTCHLLNYDSVHSTLLPKVKNHQDCLYYHDKKITLSNHKNPSLIDWKKYDVNLVLECTGQFNSRELTQKHFSTINIDNNQSKLKVLVSAPCKDSDLTIVYGVNHELITGKETIISNASCTTNCIGVVANVINNSNPIKKATINTIHSYTADQRLHDSQHKDLRRARNAQLSMIPTTTGAAKMLEIVIPSLKDKLEGIAIRVPTSNVSIVDCVFVLQNSITSEKLNQLIIEASKLPNYHRVLYYNDQPLVSVDYNGHNGSAIIDGSFTKVIDGNMCRLLAWYDNETGFCHRMLDVAKYWMKKS